MRSILYCLLLGLSVATASAQTTAPIAVGTYTARADDKANAPGVDLIVKHITADGRITGTVLEHRGGPMCGKPMPANGRVAKDGGVRVDVNDGAPEGCERTYVLTRAADGGLTGTVVRGKTTHPISFARK